MDTLAPLPTGTVTFLFTDIEGSTRLWEQAPHAMGEALARHDSLFEAIVGQHHGTVVRPRGEGDSRFAVFARASDGVAAAHLAQRSFIAESWPTPHPLRVRMALHTGEAELRTHDYYGTAVNRCARLRAIAAGGQVLLSGVTAALVRRSLPAHVQLYDFGNHGLKDIADPEHIYQLIDPELGASSQPLRSLATQGLNGLDGAVRPPLQATPLIGREDDVRAVTSLLRDMGARLFTLTGTGGTGKTRLAFEIARTVRDAYDDGALFVDLVPVHDPDLVPATIASVLGVHDVAQQPLLSSLKEYLRDRRLLLVLDNFEQVLPAAAYVSDLLSGCPLLTVLVTSREPLRSRWEHVYPLAPLRVPDTQAPADLKALATTPAVALFAMRARAVRPDFELTLENARAVAEVCVRLDGLPLAIELAAARCNVLAPQAILSRLGHRLQLLRQSAPDVPIRHQTLLAAVDWSYQLLTRSEQTVFRRLGIFVGSWTLEAAEHVAGTSALGVDTLEVHSALVDKGLLQLQAADADSREPRFRMLETLHEYALHQLALSDELDLTRERHTEFFLELAEVGEPKLRTADQGAWLKRLEAEHDNFRAALASALDRGSATESGLRLGWALGWFWFLHGHYSEGRSWLERLLEDTFGASPVLRARILARAGTLAYAQGDLERAGLLLDESLALARAGGELWLAAFALTVRGFVAEFQGQYRRGQELTTESLGVFRELEEPWGVAWALHQLGRAAHDQGDYVQADNYLRESLALRRPMGDSWGLALVLHYLGRVAHAQGKYAVAKALHEESLAISRSLDFKRYVAWALHHLARVARAEEDYGQAEEYERESLDSAIQRGDKPGIIECLEGIMGLAVASRSWTHAARLAGAVDGLRGRLGNPRPRAYQPAYERDLATIRGALGARAFGTHWRAGQKLSLEQAIEESRQAGAVPKTLAPAPADPLTARERQVSILVSRGLDSRHIAADLSITEGTVRVHVEHILSKLGLHSRAQLAAWVVEHRLRENQD